MARENTTNRGYRLPVPGDTDDWGNILNDETFEDIDEDVDGLEDLRYRAEREGVARHIGQGEIFQRAGEVALVEREAIAYDGLTPPYGRVEWGLDFGVDWRATTEAQLTDAQVGDIAQKTAAYSYTIGQTITNGIDITITGGSVFCLAIDETGSFVNPDATTRIASVNDGERVTMEMSHDADANEFTWRYEGESDSGERTQDISTWDGVSTLDDLNLIQNGEGIIWALFVEEAADVRVASGEYLQDVPR